MKRLCLLRHAEAVPSVGIPDGERPLTEAGRADAARMGRYLAAEGFEADLVLVSSARRTQETSQLALDGAAGTRRSEPRIYEASAERLLQVVSEIPAETRSALLVGHNPGMMDLARLLLGQGGDRARPAPSLSQFPTGALCIIDVPGEDWAGLQPGSGRLERFVTQASLEDAEG